MLILGLETSCDETAVSVLEVKKQKQKVKNIRVLSNVISSQVKLHAPYGGVVPHLAAREHEKNLPPVLARALKQAKVKMTDVDLIAVTAGPGLAPALWRGVNFANALAERSHKPIVATNHLRGHAYSNWLSPVGNQKSNVKNVNFPILHLVVSGGHTLLALLTGWEKFKLVGETADDAAGEAFDKVARLLGLGYPGGPAVAAAAEKLKIKNSKITLPRPMLHSKDFNFSFAGLKTAVFYKTRELGKLTPRHTAEICREFQQAVIDVLVAKTLRAARQYQVKTVALSGGVSANRELRRQLTAACGRAGIVCLTAPLAYTGDNAAMIALAGYLKTQSAKRKMQKKIPITANANWELC